MKRYTWQYKGIKVGLIVDQSSVMLWVNDACVGAKWYMRPMVYLERKGKIYNMFIY